jgi:S-formylglutathione hydrolase FrmB
MDRMAYDATLAHTAHAPCWCCRAGYLGEDREAWKAYDACEIVKAHTGPKLPLLVDQVRLRVCTSDALCAPRSLTRTAVTVSVTSAFQHRHLQVIVPPRSHAPRCKPQGTGDNFLSQLLPKNLEAACAEAAHPLTLRMHDGYDHSYFFMASFIDDHIAFHAAELAK